MGDDMKKRTHEAQTTLAAIDALGKQVVLRADALAPSIEQHLGLRKLIDEQERIRKQIDAAFGPLSKIQQTLNAHMAPLHTVAVRLSQELERFRLPQFVEIAQLVSARDKEIAYAARRFAESLPSDSIQRFLENLRSPWLDSIEQAHSLRGLVGLQGIGEALRVAQPYDDSFSKLLRNGLGDWRDSIEVRRSLAEDIVARSDFYIERGLDTSLTDFPEPAFVEALDLAEIRREPPPLIAIYAPPVPLVESDDEEGFERTNIAHSWLHRLETRIRSLIDEVMSATYGPDWPRHRLPAGLYEIWAEKKQKAEKSGSRSFPLIAYADFRDYELVMLKRDNWPLFSSRFQRQESLRESLQRLYPIRLCIAHSRIITQDDHMYLYVEVHRLIKAIQKT